MFHTFYQFRETTQNNFVCIFAFFQFRKMIKTQQNSELYRTASRFAKLKKHTKLSTLVSIRFLPANYSKFVYMYFVYCTLCVQCVCCDPVSISELCLTVENALPHLIAD